MKRIARIILATSAAVAVTVPAFGGVAAAAPRQSAPDVGTTTTETTITVRAGDSLAGLAWRHGVRLSAILRANSLDLDSIIHPGDSLVIPAGASLQVRSGSTGTTATSTPASSAGTATDYVVSAGDALAGIAWRHGVSLGALVKANGISVTSLILPGQRLQIPAATRPIPAARPTSAGATSPTPTAVPASSTAMTTAAVAQGNSSQTLLAYATAQVGAPYRFFSAGPDSFDCSGLVVAAFRTIGMNVPHQSRALSRLGSAVDWRNEPVAAGDLVFTSSINDPASITHVGIALDSSRWIQAVGVGRTVSIGSLPSDDKIMAVQRIDLP